MVRALPGTHQVKPVRVAPGPKFEPGRPFWPIAVLMCCPLGLVLVLSIVPACKSSPAPIPVPVTTPSNATMDGGLVHCPAAQVTGACENRVADDGQGGTFACVLCADHADRSCVTHTPWSYCTGEAACDDPRCHRPKGL